MSARVVVVVFLSLFALIMPQSYLSAQTESAEESVTRSATQCAVDLYREIASDEEIKILMRELWEEFVPAEEEPEYTDEDAFRDFYADQYEDFNE